MDPQSLLDEALFLGGEFFTVLTAQPAYAPEAANAEGASRASAVVLAMAKVTSQHRVAVPCILLL